MFSALIFPVEAMLFSTVRVPIMPEPEELTLPLRLDVVIVVIVSPETVPPRSPSTIIVPISPDPWAVTLPVAVRLP
jgi:hypothetical protein